MKYAKLGRSDLMVSRISFGAMSLDADEPLAKKILHQALESGINFFDTADLYQDGRNETLIGEAFSGMRDRVILASKVGNRMRPDGSGWDWVPDPAYILSAIEASLRRLKTGYIDLYQLHGGTMEDPIDEIIYTFDKLKSEGKIRYYGISSIRPVVIREYLKKSSITSVMSQYSLLDRRPEETVFPLLRESQTGVLVRGALARGLLVGKPAAAYLNHPAADVSRAAELIREATIPPHRPYDTAVQFVLSEPAVGTAVIGIRTEAQLQDALMAADSSSLHEDQVQHLKNGFPQNRYTDHR